MWGVSSVMVLSKSTVSSKISSYALFVLSQSWLCLSTCFISKTMKCILMKTGPWGLKLKDVSQILFWSLSFEYNSTSPEVSTDLYYFPQNRWLSVQTICYITKIWISLCINFNWNIFLYGIYFTQHKGK